MKATGIEPHGFTLVELLAVIILLGILGGIATTRLSSTSIFELQSSRDQLIAAFRSAQQLAMAQTDRVRFSTQGNQLTIFQDSNGDLSFSNAEAINLDGINYPFSLANNQTISSTDIDFNRLGRVSSSQTITLTQGSATVSIVISEMGFIE